MINEKNNENQTLKQLIRTIIESHPDISFDIQDNTDGLTKISDTDLNTLILNIINKRISNITEYQEPKTIQIIQSKIMSFSRLSKSPICPSF